MNYHTMNYLAIDTETGGLDASACALLSIAAIPSWDAPPFSAYIDPVGRIDAKAAEVNGYTPENWKKKGAAPLKTTAFLFLHWLHLHGKGQRFELVAHNAGFDALFVLAFQHLTGVDFQLPGLWHCTKIQLQELRDDGTLPAGSNSLNALGTLSGYWDTDPRTSEHDALQDARCALHGFAWLREKREGAGQP